MWHLLLALLSTHSSWWVVKGYEFPPTLVAGPYASYMKCQHVASQLILIEYSYDYHCEIH